MRGALTVCAELVLLAGSIAGAGPGPGPGLDWCGTARDLTGDMTQFARAVSFVQNVCCDQGHESCAGEMPQLPTTCTSQGCARAVGQTQVACRDYLEDGMGAVMTNIMDPLYALCAGTTEPSSVAITDPQAQRTPLTCGAVISDGSGVHALSGTDTISVQAPAVK